MIWAADPCGVWLATDLSQADDEQLLQTEVHTYTKPQHIHWDGRLPDAGIQLQEFQFTPEKMAELQRQDPSISAIIDLLADNDGYLSSPPPAELYQQMPAESRYYIENWQALIMRNNVLFVRQVSATYNEYYTVALPRELAQIMLSMCHGSKSAGHPGFNKTMKKYARLVSYYRMRVDCNHWVLTCDPCQRRGSPHRPRGTGNAWSPYYPNDIVSMDSRVLPESISDYKAILTIIDVNTRYVRYILLKRETAAAIYQAVLRYWIVQWGPPQTLLVDRLRANVSDLAAQFANAWNIYIRPGLSHRSLSLAVVERSHRTATDFLAKAMNDGMTLDQLTMDLLSMAVNGTYHASIGTTPLHAMTGAPQPDVRSLFPGTIHTELSPAGSPTALLSDMLTRTSFIRQQVHKHLQHATQVRNYSAGFRNTHMPFPPLAYVYALDRGAERAGTKLRNNYTLARVCRVVTPTHYRVKLLGARSAISLHRQDIKPCWAQQDKDTIIVTRADRRAPVTKVSSDQWWERMATIQRERTQRPEVPEDDMDELNRANADYNADPQGYNWSDMESDTDSDELQQASPAPRAPPHTPPATAQPRTEVNDDATVSTQSRQPPSSRQQVRRENEPPTDLTQSGGRVQRRYNTRQRAAQDTAHEQINTGRGGVNNPPETRARPTRVAKRPTRLIEQCHIRAALANEPPHYGANTPSNRHING